MKHNQKNICIPWVYYDFGIYIKSCKVYNIFFFIFLLSIFTYLLQLKMNIEFYSKFNCLLNPNVCDTDLKKKNGDLNHYVVNELNYFP